MSNQSSSAPGHPLRNDGKVRNSGFATASLMLAMFSPFSGALLPTAPISRLPLLATVFTSLLAIFFGIIALRQISRSNGRISGQIVAIAGLVLGVGLLIALLIPARSASRERTRRYHECLGNLKQIGLAIAMYADSNGGRTPWDGTPSDGSPLGSFKLLSNVTDSAKILLCPNDGRLGARAEKNFAALTTLNVGYSLVPGLIWQSGSPDSIIALDRTADYTKGSSFGGTTTRDPNHKGAGGNVLFNDGHVEFLSTIPHTVKDQNGRPGLLTP